MATVNTPDRLFIHGLRCTAHIGCKPEEQELPQALIIDVTLEVDTRPAAQADDLELTVNYAKLSKAIIRHCEESRVHLIETLAAQLASLIRQWSPLITSTTITIRKPAGLPNGDYAAIEITR